VACTVSLFGIWAVVPPGGLTPSVLRVAGTMTGGCVGGSVVVAVPPFGSAPAVQLVNDRFRVELGLTGPITVGAFVAVTVTCVGDPSCTQTVTAAVAGCSAQVSFFSADVQPGFLTPSAVLVSGFLRGCATDQVTIDSMPPGVLAPTTVMVDHYTGSFFNVPVPVLTPLQCDDPITVTAQCTGTAGCTAPPLTDRLTCSQCFRASVVITSGPCTGTPPTQAVTFTATIGIPAKTVQQFQWDYGDGQSGSPFTVDNANGTGAATYVVAEPPHAYSPGPYTATLRVVPPPFECPDFTVNVVVQCDVCPTISVAPIVIAPTCVGTTRTVIFPAQITTSAGQLAVVQWDYGDPQGGTPSLGPATVIPAGATMQPYPQSHAYQAPGTYQATLTTIVPSGCPPVVVPVTVAACPTPNCTLDITGIATAIGGCNPDDTRTVVATAVLTNQDPADRYWWTFDGAAATTSQLAGPVSHDFPAAGPGQSTHTIGLTVVRGENCLDNLQVPVLLDPCGTACPSITSINATAGRCTAGGTSREVQLIAALTGPPATTYLWTFGDGTSETRVASAGANTTHTFAAPGTYQITLKADGPGACSTDATIQFTVAACCPEATAIATAFGTCIPGTGGATDLQPVTLTAQTTGTGIAGYAWDFGDGTTIPAPSQASPPAHDYAAPGTYTATVTVTATDPNCPPTTASTTITAAACPPPVTPPPSSGGCLCVLLLVLAMLLIALASVAFLTWSCGGFGNPLLLTAAIILAVLGVLLLLLWTFLCGRTMCPAVVLLVNVFAGLAAAMGVLALVLFLLGSPGCAVGALIVGGLFAAISAGLVGAGRAIGCIP
jgi:hypothetical protein